MALLLLTQALLGAGCSTRFTGLAAREQVVGDDGGIEEGLDASDSRRDVRPAPDAPPGTIPMTGNDGGAVAVDMGLGPPPPLDTNLPPPPPDSGPVTTPPPDTALPPPRPDTGPMPPPIPSQGLVAYWKMDEPPDSVAIADAQNRNDATLYALGAGEVAFVPGKVNGGFQVRNRNAGAIVTMLSTSLDSVQGAITIGAWVRRSSESDTPHAIIARQREGREDLFWFGYTGNRLVFNGYGVGYLRAERNLPLNEWVHVAATYDGSVLRLYQNGTEVGTMNRRNGTVGPGGTKVILGAEQNDALGLESPFDGIIDEVRLYNRALSPAEVAALR